MENKPSMSRVERLHREKVTRYSIRKYSFGAASVAVAALFMFLGNGAVSVQADQIQPVQPGDTAAAPATPTLDKTQLESYISEIETKLSNGSYDNKTEESVAVLKAELESAKATLANATTQAELKTAYSKLVTRANSGLKNKPVEKKETPAVDTTEGKETVGKKADNTEKKSESNSIENTGSHDSRNRQAIPTGIQFRAEVAYSEGTNAEPNGHSDTYIINDVDGQTSSASAAQAVSRVTNYKVKYNKDASGKITSLDWLVFYNNHLENLDNKYGTDGGDVYRNYIQIPAEVNMPTAITRLKYNSPVDPKWNPQTRKFQRILPDGSALSSSVTFENPSPDTAGGLPLDKKDTFALASGWESTLYGRAIEKLAGQEERYFKSAATNSSPRTKQLVYGAALNDKRLIVDRSTTGGDGYDGYVWSFTTTVPNDTTNEQLKDMKVVFGMMRSATAGANAAFANIAANPVKMWQSDVSPEPTGKDQTVKAGQQPDATKSIANLDTLPKGTTVAYKEAVDTQSPGEKQATAVVTYPDTSTREVPVKVIVENEAVAAPVVNTNAKARNTVLSTDEELTGTGTPGATVKVTVKDPEGTTVISEKTTQVGEDGTWKLPLDKGLNSNEALPGASEAARRFYAPKNKVEVTQVVNGVSSAATAVTVSEGASTILPSAAAKDGKSVVAGAKEVTVTIPHDAGIAYFWYTNKNDNSKPQIDIKREADGNFVISGNNAGKATVKNVVKGAFSDTVTLTLTEPAKEGANLEIIPHNGLATKGTYLGRANIPVTNEKPVVSSATSSDETVVPMGGTVNLSTLAKVTDHEDDQNATLGTKGTPRVVSINGDTSKTTLEAGDLATPGTYTVKYKAVDSQGKESDEYTHTVTVRDSSPVVNTKARNTIYSTDNEITGKGIPGATIKVTVKDPEGTTVISEKTTQVGEDGTWKLPLDKGLNSNEALRGGSEASRTFYAPKNKVEVTQTVNGIESEKADLEVSIGESKILPSEAAKDQTSVVAGAKKVVLTVPHDTGYSYFWYKDKETNSAPQVTLKRGEDRGWSITENPERATIESVKHGDFVDTITLTLTKPVAEGKNNIQIISHNGSASHGSYSGKYSVNVTNEAPVVSSATNSDVTTVNVGGTVNLSTLAKVTDHEDDQNATLGTKGTPTVVSINGDTSKTTLEAADLATSGTYVVKYKAVDSQGKESNEYEHTVKVNQAPTVELPYSNPDKKQIYVYTGEKTDLTFKASDDTTVKDLYLRNKGLDESDNASVYGFTIGKVTDSAVASGEGTVSDDKKIATIKMVGVTNLRAGQKWTSFIEAKDNDGVKSMPANEAYNVENNYELRRRKLGYVEFIVKSQTDKYDIKTPTEKVAVTDPANVTEADLAKVKEKLQLEYNQDNDDANIAKDTAVDKNGKIQSVTKDGNNLVVTYTDGSTDTKPLSEFVTLDKEPAIDAVKKAAEAKIAEINKTPNATDDEKQAAINKVNADKKKALDEIAKPEVTTKDALDKAQTAGTDAIAKDNPVVAKKDEAKKAIDDALKAKEAAIAARPDLTDDEKKAAKDAAKAAADKAKDAVDAATTNAAVDKAKEDGTTAVANVTPVAKAEAKKAIAKALEAKNSEIDKRTDLTDEEKTAAKNEAKDKADAQLAKINEQPDAAATPTAAKTAQDVVDAAKKTGVAEVTAVNPVAVKKPAAKKAIDDALKAKEDAIDARTDLTDDEKKAAKDAAKAAAAKAKPAVDAATTDAAVDTAKGTGTGDIAKVNPVAKEAAKKAVADELAKKEAAIDGRKDLTDEEKAAAKKEAQDKAKKATDAINAQPSNAETPEKAAEAQKAVDAAKKSGVDEVAAVNPEAVTKPAAKKAIEDKLAKQLEEIANTPDATDEEKKVAEDAAKAAAEKAKEEIDKAETDAAVEAKKDEAVGKDGAKGTIDKLPVVEDKPNARKAIDEEATAKKAEIDARNDLTPEAKAKLKAKVDKIAEKAKEGIDAVTSKTDVDVIKEADKAAIKAIGEVNRPIDKVLVKDPSALTNEEKAKILEEVKKVNPTAKEVKYDENGNIEVTTEAGDKGIINPTKLVKTEDQLDNGKGGNDINKPLDKVIVKDPSNLTDEEKAKIVAKVEEVNPGAIVTIDENGTVSVSTPDGKTAAIPASDLVRTKEDTAKPDAGNSKIVKPADKVVGEANDPDDQAKVEAKLRELNPETKSVKFDENGNATVTLNDGTTATIPSEDLFRSEADVTKPNAGNDIVKPADKTVVANPDALTPEEKKAIEDKVKAVNPGATVVVDDKGNTTVTTPSGNTAVIPAADLTKSGEDAAKPNAGNDVVKPADKTEVANPDKLTDAEKKAIEDKVKAVNPDATVVVDDKGNATVTTPEGKTAVIPAADLTKSVADAGKANAGNAVNTPAAKVEVKDPAKLTDEEKAKVKEAIEAVNPGSKVVVDDKGNATVTTPEGNTAVIPAADVTKSVADAGKANAGNAVNTPATRVLVGDKAKLTADEIEKVKESIKAVNPGATVVVDENGNATVTTPEGKTATIPAAQLVKDAKDVAAKNNGENINVDFEKETVADFNNLTDAEKEAAKAKIKGANADVVEVIFDKAGNATVITKDGKVYTIVAKDIFKQRPYVPSNGGGNNGATNTDAKVDKAKLEGAIHQLDELIIKESAKFDAETAKEANALSADAKKVFANADASQAEVDAMVKRIEDFMAKVASSTDHATPANDQAAQTPAVAPATTQAAANASQEAATNARKAAKELPNTGTADSTVAMVAAAASALLGLGLAGRRRKEDEEA